MFGIQCCSRLSSLAKSEKHPSEESMGKIGSLGRRNSLGIHKCLPAVRTSSDPASVSNSCIQIPSSSPLNGRKVLSTFLPFLLYDWQPLVSALRSPKPAGLSYRYLLATQFPGQSCTWCLSSAFLSFTIFFTACSGFPKRCETLQISFYIQ